ncbi:hypothetical protein EHS25_000619 [Saitozyma podzolica]|uniref:SnoaL-like domain-containing protein n=1 Tax=Saitozyma podzolica TaxID=1890683 RepID=A0A427YWP8_9TREE|nr:hypothetical protein EHS25_000619 [Saitozyma podzolica]
MSAQQAETPQCAARYDPNVPSEAPVPLPSAPLQTLAPGITFQPPLSRRGHGPGLIAFLPPSRGTIEKSTLKHLDPEPVQKWAEEGYGVVGVSDIEETEQTIAQALTLSLQCLAESPSIDIKDKIVYHAPFIPLLLNLLPSYPAIAALITHGFACSTSPIPAMAHVPKASDNPIAMCPTSTGPRIKVHTYDVASPHFVIPSSGKGSFSPSSAAMAHTRSLVFLRSHIGGPFFDIEEIWEEHTFFEFVDRSVAKTMGTMVAEPYVNHVPTMTGGVGRTALAEFYRDHFIFSNPASELVTVSRTVGPDRVVDEFVFRCVHDRMIDWLLPGVPPSGNQLEIPMIAVVNVRGDRLYHEHIWWDQATALQQAGHLPAFVPFGEDGKAKLRLPTDGYASARLLLDETAGQSNLMFGEDWGVQSK